MSQSRTLPRSPIPRTERARPSLGARRFGYSVAIAVNLLMLVLMNWAPGWDALPFLSEETTRVVGWVNASILVVVAANLVYAVRDPRWLKPLGDALTTAFGIVVMIRIWQVFPLTPDVARSGWGDLAHVLLAVGIGGSVIGVIAGLAGFVRAVQRR